VRASLSNGKVHRLESFWFGIGSSSENSSRQSGVHATDDHSVGVAVSALVCRVARSIISSLPRIQGMPVPKQPRT
jgi:hypothetical protein